jgi:hypothetical protein
MSSLATAEKSAPSPAPNPGGVHFAEGARHADLCAELRARRYLVAPVATAERGKLRHAIDDAVEGALALRGALPPGVEVGAALEPTIRDQIFRARALGATGLAIALPRLGEGDDDLLDHEDGATLSAWLSAARRTPLLVVLDDRDRAARVLAPVPLADLAGPSPLAAPESSPPPSGEIAIAAPPAPEAPIAPPPVLAMPRRGVMKKRSSLRVEVTASEQTEIATESPRADSAVLQGATEPPVPVEPAVAAPIEPAPIEAAPEPPRADPAILKTIAALMPPVPPIDAPAQNEPVTLTPPPPAVSEADAEPPRERAVRRAVDAAEWRSMAIDLDKARGPKPVSTIERLFALRYMPLLGAVSRGEGDSAVRGVVDAWRQSFEHSYREAFSALRVTGKRPPMVFDAPEIAAKIGRLNGARAVKLMLVDAMRFDIGERVGERLKDKLAGRAVCVDRMLLWSALPTTTQTQMGLLGRGPDGLRDAEPASEPEPEIVRGRAVGTVRRERVGAREVMKLDLVEARLRNTGPGYDDRLDALADEVAPILVKYVETLPPRTLLFVFGDHGFRLPTSADARSTAPATQGGVSPEEVLVPAQAWLVGGVH